MHLLLNLALPVQVRRQPVHLLNAPFAHGADLGFYEIGFNYVMDVLDSGTAVASEVSARIDRILRSMNPDIVSSMPYL